MIGALFAVLGNNSLTIIVQRIMLNVFYKNLSGEELQYEWMAGIGFVFV